MSGLHLRQRLFAYMNANSCETSDVRFAARKQALFWNLHGRLLEIGPGPGPNLRYYPPDVDWLGVEPNPFMHPYLRQTIRALSLSEQRFRIHPGDPSGRLPAEDESLDGVICTMVLCSVTHPEAMLREVLRVLKPGGRFLFMEHVAAPAGSPLRRWQDRLQPAWSLMTGGCHPNRETAETISRAGFAQVQIEPFEYPDGWLVRPQIAGVAIK